MSNAGAPVRRSLPLTALLAGARLGLGRPLGREWATLVVLALGCGAAVGRCLRHLAPLDAPDRTLGYVFGLVVPLASFALVGLATGQSGLAEAVWPLGRLGLERRYAAAGLLAATMAVAAAVAMGTATLALVTAFGPVPGLTADLRATLPVAALGGASYVAWFGLGSAVLVRGRGRWLALAADFTIGTGAGVLAASCPRAHLENLLGGAAVAGLGQASSSALVLAATVVLAGLAANRAGS